MSGFFRFSRFRYGQGFTAALKNSLSAALESLQFRSDENMSRVDEFRRLGSVSVIRLMLSDGDGALVPARMDTFRRLLESEQSPEEVERQIAELKVMTPLSADDTVLALEALSADERRRLLHFLLSLGAAAETPDRAVAEVKRIFQRLGVEEEVFQALRSDTLRSEERRRRIVGSGAGIVVALVVLAVFVITATLLRSVIFGLIVAYVLLPVEKYFEHRQRRQTGIAYYLFLILGFPYIPLCRLSQRIMRRDTSDGAGKRDEKRRRERKIIAQAVAQTALLATILCCGLFMLLSELTEHYVGDFGTLGTTAAAVVAPAVNGDGHAVEQPNVEDTFYNVVTRIEERLDKLRMRFERLPVIRFALDQVVLILRDEEARRELLGTLLKTSGGIFHFTVGVLGVIGTIACDILLTVFFALLFLLKLAEFCRDDESRGRKSEYLVRTVFNGNWLPDATDVAVGEAKRIVGGIMERLRIWVRGYLTLVLVDSTVYTTLFFLLEVPYFPLLGILAGCGILLPYVGPILSAAVTILVTLAAGGSSGAQVLGIVAAYLLYNGVIEQFILYPAVIGESLGLTTLETIVVVLLGAVFAGIPGMVLALPAASVLKYLIPQIHHYLRMRGVDRT